ncbi:MAG: hypothetical protein KME17_04970 [Cyanosarcina radialis HA8281-LM2]|nr:hypothetical protein [Cyanosarcina radialis HA8281-LM2]
MEYARGAISLMLPFGFADPIFSTLDFKTVLPTLWIYRKLGLKELL